jgi:hypothetical protein
VSGKPAVGTAAWLVTKVSTALGDRQGFPLGRLPVQHLKAGRPVLNKRQYRGQTCDLNLLALSLVDRIALVHGSAHSHRQMSMSKPVGPEHGDRHSLGPPRAQTPQERHAGLLELDVQPSAASICPPGGRGRSLSWCGELTFRTPTRHRAPDQQPGRILIPGDGAAGDQGAQDRLANPAMAATRRLQPVPPQRPPGAMVPGTPAVM